MSKNEVDKLWTDIKEATKNNDPITVTRLTTAMLALVRSGNSLPQELRGMSLDQWEEAYPTIQVIRNKSVIVTADNADLYKLSDYTIVWEQNEKGLFLLVNKALVDN